MGKHTNTSDIIGSEIDSCDTGTNALFKVAMFSNAKSGSTDISEIFLNILKRHILTSPKTTIEGSFSFLSFANFKEKFISAAIEDIKKLRANWLLNNCDPYELANMEVKNAQLYFTQLEKRQFEEYVAGWQEPQELLFKEFKKIRRKFVFEFVKRNLHFLLFWCLIFLAIFIGLHITSKENSLTMWEQLKGWIYFLLQRLN